MKKIAPILFSLMLFLMLPLNTFASNLDDIKAIIESDYVGDIDGDLQSATTIEDVIEMLDPYSAYFTAQEYAAFTNSVDLKSVGIGVVLEKHDKGILIVDVIENGSAHKSDIVPGDIITKVGNRSTVDMTIEEAQSLILGEENTKVVLTILKTTGTTVEKLITRQSFTLPNVTTDLLYGNVGYISLNSFSMDGAKLVTNAYNNLKKQGATSFILDLQYNGGGYVSTAEELIGMFPNALNAYRLRLSTGMYVTPAIKQTTQFPANTRVLVNRFSASASEMTAAALLDQKSAILYGETTYGKGTMQGFYELSDGSYLKLTIGEFIGPKGTYVKGVGVTPNIVTTTEPLYQAHYDSIKSKLTNYKQLKSLKNVPTTKTFNITFNKEISETISEDSIELIELGGDPIEFSYKVNGNQVMITPKEPLTPGAEYMLLTHPSIKDTKGKTLKTGIYLHITVKSEE